MKLLGGLVDWLDSRTGIRTARKHLLDEPIPPGVGWWFVTGSVLILLLSVQLIKCPCHGGVYDREGMVKSGPPPKSLARLMTRVDGDQILVQI